MDDEPQTMTAIEAERRGTQVVTFRGKRIDDMTREEAIAALKVAGQLLLAATNATPWKEPPAPRAPGKEGV